MEIIKFVSLNKDHQQFAATLRKNVSNYFKEKGISTKGNLNMKIKSIVMLLLYLAPLALVLIFPMSAWLALLLAVVMGIGMAGTGMSVMHDALHGSYSSRKWVNKLLGSTIYLLGSNVFNWKVQHNILHHAYTNSDGLDEDIDSRGVLRLSEHAPLRKIHRFQHIHAFFFYGFLTLYKLFIGDFRQLMDYGRTGIAQKHKIRIALEFVKMASVKTLYLLFVVGLPMLLTDFHWWQVLLGFLAMQMVTGCILSTIFQMAHIVEGADQPMPADGIIENEWAVYQLLTTSNFARNNHFLNWYIGGLNFQIEHHLFPNICHVHYRNISTIVEQTVREFGITYNLKPTFTKALASHLRRLKALGRQQAPSSC